MAVTRIGQSTIKQGLKKNETFTAGIPPILGKFYHMGTVEVGAGGASSIEFTNIPAIYKHLQIRGITQQGTTSGSGHIYTLYRLNNDSTSGNYANHALLGTGSAVSSSSITGAAYNYGYIASTYYNSSSTSIFGGVVIDILDYSNTNKNTTIRAASGFDANGSGISALWSSLWLSTNAVSNVTIYANLPTAGSPFFRQYSALSIYGVK